MLAALLEQRLGEGLPDSFPSQGSRNPHRTSLINVTKPERFRLRLVGDTTQLIPGMPLKGGPDVTALLSLTDGE